MSNTDDMPISIRVLIESVYIINGFINRNRILIINTCGFTNYENFFLQQTSENLFPTEHAEREFFWQLK